MTKKIPLVKTNPKVLIICEGAEENDYLNRLKTLQVWSRSCSIEIKNAQSIDKIAGMYEYYYSTNSYTLIVVFCDTEKSPYQQFLNLKKTIQAFHNKRNVEGIVFFANPCTMQIVLSHLEKVALKSNDKTDNSELIHRLTGVKDYRATDKQRRSIMNKLTADNYRIMEEHLRDIALDYKVIPSSNVLVLFKALDSGDRDWIKNTKKKIEE